MSDTLWRSPGFLTFLRAEGRCVVCGRGNCDPAHGPNAGMSAKGPDSGCIPLDRSCHLEQHRIGWPAFEAVYQFIREAEAAKWWAAYLRKE